MFGINHFHHNIETPFKAFFNVFNYKTIRQCTSLDISLRLLHDPGA